MVRSFIVAVVLILATGCSQGTSSDAQRDQEPTSENSSGPRDSDSRPSSEDNAQPSTLIIPAIDVRAEVVGVGLNPDGSMETPQYEQNQTGWYVEGPPPGAPGAAVVVGHLDNENGDDVFADLGDLSQGDEVTVLDDAGDEHTWQVQRVQQTDKDELPYEQIWTDSEEPLLRLVTCAGEYTQEYEDNLIVYAEPV